MVTYEGVTKLLDFGIAKNLARKGRTQVGMVKGTSGYMSPEQILGEQLDARSDLFSLGVVLHECLTGMRLFHAKTASATANAVLNGQVPPPSRVNKAVPPELDAIVLKALSKKREDRYASTLEFARALERAVGRLVWHPEQNAELIRSLFADRLDQTRKLLAGNLMPGEGTGEVRVSQIFSLSSVHPPPGSQASQAFHANQVPTPDDYPAEEAEEEEGTQLNLPTITPALPAAHRAAPSPALTAPPAVKPQPPPPPPPPEPQKPPTPPRGAPAPRRPTTATPTVAPPPAPPESLSMRRPVFEPLPQKRLAPPPPPPSEALPPPPPPEDTGNTQPTQPNEDKPRTRAPAWADENATRAAPSEEALSNGRGRTVSREARVAPEEDEENTQQDSLSSRPGPRQSQVRPRSLSSDRVSRAGNNVPPRGQSRRVPTPPPEDSVSEIVTHPVRVFKAPDEEPEDTNESRVPEGEDGMSLVTITKPGTPSLPKSRGGLLVVLAVLALLVLGGGAAVALGLDGGRISSLWAPAPAAPVAPVVPADSPTPPAPSETGTPTGSTPPEAAAPVPAQPEPATPAPEPVATATPATPAPTPAEPEAAPGTTTSPVPSGAEAVALKVAAALEKTEPEPEPEPEPAVVPEPEEDPAPTIKRTRVTSKRPKKDPKPSGEESPPSDWAPVEEKPESASAAAATGDPGIFTLVTAPYAKVYLGKRYLGDTPLFKINLPVGKHTLRLVGPDGQSLKLPVEIKSGETTKLNLELSTLAQE